MLNKVWGAFFFVAFAVGLTKTFFFGDYGVCCEFFMSCCMLL